MRKLARRALTATAVAATSIALTAVPAFAISFTAVNNGTVGLADTTTGVFVICQSSVLTGNANIGPVPIGTSLIDTATADFSDCVANGSIPASVQALNLPWAFIADSYSSGVTDGRLTGAALLLSMPSLPCTVVIGSPGDISGTYTNSSSILDLDDNDLKVTNVGPCPPNSFALNDLVVFKAQYQFQ